jgi:hypothetical protein
MDLPVYQMVINNEETSDVEVSFVALVDKPAIERNFLAFKDQKLYFDINEEKRIISGPAMVADQLIYRKDASGEFNVFFSAETVRDIAVKFFKKDYQKNLNLFHDPSMSLDGVTIFESFVSDKSRGIQPMKGYEDLPDGSWFISAKVDNDQVWSKIKSGEVKGFSVEGIFSFLKKGENRPILQSSHFEEENSFMSELKDLWKQFKDNFIGDVNTPAAPVALSDYQLKDGTAITVDKLEVGGVVMVAGIPAPAGDHELMDGTKLTVGDGGFISAVTPAQNDAAAPGMPNDYSSDFAAINEKFTAYEAKFTEQANQLNAFTEKFQKANDTINSLVELVGKIIETPTAETVTGDKNTFSTQKSTTKFDRIKELAETFKKIKKS